ncbi:MAG: hypothetical protein WCD71_15805, partial [Candidatus Sulfotelmatobacter sp.]
MPSNSSARCRRWKTPKLVAVFHVEADAVVAHQNDHLPVFWPGADLDDRALPRAGELERIGDQVLKNLLDQNGITLGSGKVCNLPTNDPVFDLRLQERNDFFDDRIQARRLE